MMYSDLQQSIGDRSSINNMWPANKWRNKVLSWAHHFQCDCKFWSEEVQATPVVSTHPGMSGKPEYSSFFILWLKRYLSILRQIQNLFKTIRWPCIFCPPITFTGLYLVSVSVFPNLPGPWPTAEGMASAFRMVGICHCPPPTAAHQFLKHAMKKLKEYQNECSVKVWILLCTNWLHLEWNANEIPLDKYGILLTFILMVLVSILRKS
jgi:hypothetical protein